MLSFTDSSWHSDFWSCLLDALPFVPPDIFLLISHCFPFGNHPCRPAEPTEHQDVREDSEVPVIPLHSDEDDTSELENKAPINDTTEKPGDADMLMKHMNLSCRDLHAVGAFVSSYVCILKRFMFFVTASCFLLQESTATVLWQLEKWPVPWQHLNRRSPFQPRKKKCSPHAKVGTVQALFLL